MISQESSCRCHRSTAILIGPPYQNQVFGLMSRFTRRSINPHDPMPSAGDTVILSGHSSGEESRPILLLKWGWLLTLRFMTTGMHTVSVQVRRVCSAVCRICPQTWGWAWILGFSFVCSMEFHQIYYYMLEGMHMCVKWIIKNEGAESDWSVKWWMGHVWNFLRAGIWVTHVHTWPKKGLESELEFKCVTFTCTWSRSTIWSRCSPQCCN